MVANFFGDPDRARRSKEVKFAQDIEALVSEMQRQKFHVLNKKGHFVPAPPKKPSRAKNPPTKSAPVRSAVIDILVKGAEEWNGKFETYIRGTTYDPALGYPLASVQETVSHDTTLNNNTVFDLATGNPISYDNYEDLHGEDAGEGRMGIGALGGGDEYGTE